MNQAFKDCIEKKRIFEFPEARKLVSKELKIACDDLNEAKDDDFVKSPSAALCCILSHCGVPVSTPHSLVFAGLASESFYFVV